MIDAKILLENEKDQHLNVFWQYEGKPELENNITKAFINTFMSLEETAKRRFFSRILKICLPDKVLRFECYLQKKPKEEVVRSVSEERKVLFAFSPTGKTWGPPDVEKEERIREYIEKMVRETFPEASTSFIHEKCEEEVKATLEYRDGKGESIPDAWIIAYEGKMPLYCVAMENKLHNLDTFQLRNHCAKSLYVSTERIVYCKYSKLLEELSEMKGYLIGDFLRYMYFLNYWEVNNLSQIKYMDEEHRVIYSERWCKQLLEEVGGKEVTWHRNWMYRYFSENRFNHEVGLHYNAGSKSFEMPLYFGSTQKCAREMYKHLEKVGFCKNKKYIYRNSFHFQYVGTGKNVNGGKAHEAGTYYSYDDLSIEKYIEFWINHLDYIHQMHKEERRKVLEEMLKADIIHKSDYEAIRKFSDGYPKALNICPEVGVFCNWEFEEALKLDDEGRFANDIRRAIREVYKSFGT